MQIKKTRLNHVDKQNETKPQIAPCTVYARYREALLLHHRLEYLRAKNTHLRILVAKAKDQFEELRPCLMLVDLVSKAERARFKAGQGTHVTRVRNEERMETRPRKQRGQTDHFLKKLKS
jgi:hypothetical protein